MPANPAASVTLEKRLSYRCSRISSRITRQMVPQLESHGLTVITWRVMAVVGRYQPLSAKAVAEHTTTDAFYVSRAIEQLVTQGLLMRGADPTDRRRARLELTRTGQKVHRTIERALNRVEAALVRSLDPAQRQALDDALDFLDRQTASLQNDRP